MRYLFLIVCLTTIFLSSCEEKRPEINVPNIDGFERNLLPLPNQIIKGESGFALDQYTAIYTQETAEDFQDIGELLAQEIQDHTGLALAVNPASKKDIDHVIVFNQSSNLESKSKEAYHITSKKDSLIIDSPSAEGSFRAMQTLLQLLPANANDTLADYPVFPIPAVEIIDSPNFEYRGTMLDVSRHFFSVEEIKPYIDVLSRYKINFLHLHLSDDQGWRIEIKSYPKLTEIGGATEVGGESGGFFTQEQYGDIVNYAADRFITIVPEIDMPGHTNAASLSYPFLNGNGKQLAPYTGMRVGFSTFNTAADTTYAFIDSVIGEIAALSPGPYFHIGGDESHVTKKADYLYFINRVEDIVHKHGKQMMGWDDISVADLEAGAVAQLWASEDNAKTAVSKDMTVVMSPAKKAYLDMKYDKDSKHGLTWAGAISVKDGYDWDPETYADIPRESILGIEAPLWSETISNLDELEYLAFPRLLGYAELGWTNAEHRDWESYKGRLINQKPYLDKMDVQPGAWVE